MKRNINYVDETDELLNATCYFINNFSTVFLSGTQVCDEEIFFLPPDSLN